MMASSHNPDVVFLDLGLPDFDGIEVIRQIRSWSNMPIIVISARSEDADKIEALDSGADDYLTKPFSVEELLARLRVTIRRLSLMNSDSSADQSVYTNGKLTIDYSAGVRLSGRGGAEADAHGVQAALPSGQKHREGPDPYLYHPEHLGRNWDNDIASLRVFMTTLRKKSSPPGLPKYIQTHIGIGYRMLKVD